MRTVIATLSVNVDVEDDNGDEQVQAQAREVLREMLRTGADVSIEAAEPVVAVGDPVPGIARTFVTFDVMHPANVEITSIKDALYHADEGLGVGLFEYLRTEPVPPEHVRALLLARDSDDDFFDVEVELAETEAAGDEYRSPEDCKASGAHLRSVDDDGFCNGCGHGPEGDDADAEVAEIQELLKPVGDLPADGVRYVARFTPEAWQNDYAVEVDAEGPREWDATAAVGRNRAYFDALPGRVGGSWEDGVTDNDDVLLSDPDTPEWARNWHGPSTVTVRRVGSDG